MKRMNAKIARLIIYTLLLGAVGGLHAQNLPPVRSNTTCIPPHLHRLPDWFRRSDDAFTLQIDLLDASVPAATLRLRMMLVSDRISIENSRPLPRTFRINGGETLTLRTAALYESCNWQTLRFRGIPLL